MKNVLLCLLFSFILFGCKKNLENPDPTSTQAVVDQGVKFYLDAKNNPEKFDSTRIQLTIAGDSVTGIVPTLSSEKSFALSFEPSTANLKVNGVSQKSGVTINDFTAPVTYTYTNAQGETKTFRVIIKNFTGLPILFLTTTAPVESKDTYVSGSLSVNTNGQFTQLPVMPLTIKGRGNTTWDMPKKPYRIKFNSKQSLFGLTSAKNWVLLANYTDKTLLRNAVAFDIGHQLSADFTPDYRFVEVVLNGVYQGSYLLTEQVEVNPGRVDINELTTSDDDDSGISGGYLLEVDQRLDASHFFYTGNGIPFTIKSPDDITTKQLSYIQTYIEQTEKAIYAADFADPENGYAKFINVDSFINWYLVNELMKNNDALDYSSIFYYKDRNGKLGMGPIWDFDLAAGNYEGTESNNPTGWWIRYTNWFYPLFKDPAFQAKVKQRWSEIKPLLPIILAHIDENAAYLDLSQRQNFGTWDILNTNVWPNSQVAGSYLGEVEYLKTWLQTRINWIDQNL